MENALPRFRVGDVNHPAKNSPVGRRAENGRAQNSVEMLVGMRMVPKDQLLCRSTEPFAYVHIEPALPVAMSERRCRRGDGELVGHEVIVSDRIGGEMCQVAERERAKCL